MFLLCEKYLFFSDGSMKTSDTTIVFRHLVREVKEADSKSAGLCPRRFESCRCRSSFVEVGSVAEWSKALDSSSSLFGGVGSNPT